MSIFMEFWAMLWECCVAIFWATAYCFIPAPQKSVKGQVVLITGAGNGIGQLMAVEFAKRGAIIVAWDVREDWNRGTAEKVQELGGEIHTYTCDVSKKEHVFATAQKVISNVGQVDILINNAGIVTGRKFLECPDEMIVKTMEVNMLAHFWTTKSFLPGMMTRNHGHIVNVASMAGIVGANGLADYCASKFANIGFTESLDCEIRSANKTGIYTTTVCPYFIGTGMFEGCKTKFPWLLPVLDPVWAKDRIVQAVLTNQSILFLPRIMYMLSILKGLLPVDAAMAIHKFTGAANFMDPFVGRK